MENNLRLNISETKQLIVEGEKDTETHSPVYVRVAEGQQVIADLGSWEPVGVCNDQWPLLCVWVLRKKKSTEMASTRISATQSIHIGLIIFLYPSLYHTYLSGVSVWGERGETEQVRETQSERERESLSGKRQSKRISACEESWLVSCYLFYL